VRRSASSLAALVLSASLLAGCSSGSEPSSQPTAEASPSADASTTAAAPSLEYPGENGRTALELLLEADPSAVVEGEGEMAFVTSIQDRAADPESEFWALYVDGEQAQVGAGSLETEDGQTLTWKLETF
jgi:Domain of unknown function (DUF4430)